MANAAEKSRPSMSDGGKPQQRYRISPVVRAFLILPLIFGAIVGAEALENFASPVLASWVSQLIVAGIASVIGFLLLNPLRRRWDHMEDHLHLAEARYKTVVEQIPAITYTSTLGPDPAILYISPQVESILGFPRQSWVDDSTLWAQHVHPEDRERAELSANRAREAGLPFAVDYRMIAQDGRTMWFSESAAPTRDEQGQLLNYQGVIYDITGWRQSEQALRESEARYRTMFDAMSEGCYLAEIMVDGEGKAYDYRFLEANPAVEHHMGFKPEQIVGKTAREVMGTLNPEALELYGEVARTGKPARLVFYSQALGRITDASAFCPSEGQFGSLFLDVSTNKRTEERLRASEERFRAIVDDQTEFIARFTPDGTLTFVNSAFAQYLHIPSEQLIGQNVFDFVREEERSPIRLDLAGLTPANPTMTFTRLASRADGILHHQEWTGRGLFDAAGGFAEYQIVGRDITERVQAEQALRDSEALYRLLAENMTDSVWLMDMSLHITYLSPSITRIRGFTLDEVNSRPPDQQMTADSFLRVEELIAEVLTSENLHGPNPRLSFTVDLEFYTRERSTFWSETTFTFLRDERGQPNVIQCSGHDITERKRAQAALRQSERFLYNVIENIPDMVFVKDAVDLKFVLFNKAGKELLGMTDTSVIGKSDFDTLPGHIAEQYVAGDKEVLKNKRLLDIPEELTETKSGETRILHTKKIPILDEQGVPRYLLGISEDVTERKQAIKQIRQQVERLTALNVGAQQLAESLDSIKLAADVARTCVDSFGVRLAWVGHAESDGLVRVLTQFPLESDYLHQAVIRWDDTPEGRGAAGQAIRSGTPIVFANLMDAPLAPPLRKRALELGYRSVAAFPLVSRQQVFGMLNLYSDQPDFFTPERVQFFHSYALQAAAALENARLFEETERRLNQAQGLRKIDAAITSNFDVRTTLDVILEQTLAQLKVDAACVLLYDSQARLLTYAAGRGFRTEVVRQTRLRLGEGFAGRAVLECRTIIDTMRRIEGEDTSYARLLNLAAAEGFVAQGVTALVAKGQVRGVLQVFHRAPPTCSNEWLDYFETLAGQAAIALDNATLFHGLQRSNDELAQAYDATLEGWSHALDLRDKETEGHTQRVATLTEQLARAMGLDEEKIVHARRGAILHDIGKMGVPDAILLKPGPLTEEEWVVMRRHPLYAYEMLSPIQYLRPALDIPYCHHEKWDGTGYPRGLKGLQIPFVARLFAVVDVWDALTHDRPYRQAWPAEKVRAYIRSLSGTHFDPEVATMFLNLELDA